MKENPVLPTDFKFGGKSLIEALKKEDADYINKAYDTIEREKRDIAKGIEWKI